MTDERHEQQPGLQQAAHDVAASKRQAEKDLQRAREHAREHLTLARKLRELRESNHFAELLEAALRGNRG
ncbi:DUF7620 family protein [Nonomuraea aridisoli]|uniref:Uncharacterized protein n=1 Tax=Nonomuraea aridisoli TaxID=2070368 RepID=A0A2W2EDK5_9ACTN|nr:hypothetical protein [Nonomuraea aridisoli]PZG20591.1 hypothetical protein C1J01_08795 [Nonomuraea aridisoli]